MSSENWKLCVDFPEYEVSNFGRVRSIDREVLTANGQRRKYRGRILSPATDGKGYQRVGLWRDNKQHGRIVHRLVLEAFIRRMEPEEEGNHLDFDKGNNRLNNLEITSPEGNVEHATNGGRLAKKLTADQVGEIKRSLKENETRQKIADRFGVSYPLVRLIDIGELWQRVQPAG